MYWTFDPSDYLHKHKMVAVLTDKKTSLHKHKMGDVTACWDISDIN